MPSIRTLQRSRAVESAPRQRLLLRLLRRPEQRPSRRWLARTHPADIASLWARLTPAEQERLLEVLRQLRLAGKVLLELPPVQQREALGLLEDGPLAEVLARLPVHEVATLSGQLSEDRRHRIFEQLDPGRVAQIENLLRFGPGTAGALMNPEVPAFSGDETVARTLERIRQLAEGRRLFYLYVIDDRRHLLGIVSLWQLVSAHPEKRLRELVSAGVVAVRADTPEAEVARKFERYDLLVLPVVDENGTLAGVISVDDVFDVVEARSAQDLYRLANLNLEEGADTPPLRSVRLRMPWLLVNLGTAFLAAWVVSLFEATLAKYIVLASFMPIVAGMGGNAGTQTLTVVVRALALRQLEERSAGRLLARQSLIGFTNGVFTGTLLGIIAFLWEGNAALSFVLFIAEAVNLTVAGLFGTLVPLTLDRLRLDPALGSSIFVTTATDVCGFLSFLGTATLLLGLLVP